MSIVQSPSNDGNGEISHGVSARRRSLARNTPHISVSACDYITHADTLPAGTLVILLLRVSSGRQRKRKNLDDQKAALTAYAEQRGLVVVGIITHVGSGWDTEWLRNASTAAQEKNAILLAESTDRIVRSPHYDKTNQDAVAGKTELDAVRMVTKETTLATMLHPDTHPRDVRSNQTRRGRAGKNKKGGRPSKKADYLSTVQTLASQGMTCRQIAARLDGRVDYSTVSRWLKKCCER